MGRLREMFSANRDSGTGAIMPFLTAGFPTQKDFISLLRTLDCSGASALEIGIPFSDPIADGPVIAASMHSSLATGTTPDSVMDAVRSIRAEVTVPLIAMLSMSIVHQRGGAKFVHELVDSGFDGLIIPDADLDGLDDIIQAITARDVAFSTLVAPDSTSARVAKITRNCREFVYLLTRRGLTGERADVPVIDQSVSMIRESTELPIAAGFGISTAAHVEGVLDNAEGAIVGSALIKVISNAHRNGDAVAQAARAFLEPLFSTAAGLPPQRPE
jgi:tryptophan synthase alpha chain